MGLNTALIVRNDFLHEIRGDSEFGQKVYSAIISRGREYHGQSFDALPSAHADYLQIAAIGGNTIRLLGFGGTYQSDDEAALRYLAGSMGFRLVRKAVK